MKLTTYDVATQQIFDLILIVVREGSTESSLKAKMQEYDLITTDDLLKELSLSEPRKQDLFSKKHPNARFQLHIVTKNLSNTNAQKHAVKLSKDYEVFTHKSVLVDIDLLQDEGFENLAASAWLTGMLISDYDIGLYRSVKKPAAWQEICIKTQLNLAEEDLVNSLHLANTTKSVMTLVNAPSNKKDSKTLSDWALSSSKDHGYSCSIIEKEQLKSMRMDAILAVNRGSEIPARLIICEHKPENPIATICLVGKGVTFDTGGLSIKGSKNMHYMKSDMGGAAAVLGTLEIIAKYKLNYHVVGIVPATDNSVDALAINPGDVIDSYSGKTIEVIDTDAEGRLVLADALNFAVKKYNPHILIDLATLTGSAYRTLGTSAAAVMTPNDELLNTLQEASNTTGERIWRLPLYKEHGEMMQSDIADIKNLSDAPLAGASTAAKFLEFFTENHPRWAHFDIAGMAFGSGPLAKSHHASGFGVYLLSEWLKSDALENYIQK